MTQLKECPFKHRSSSVRVNWWMGIYLNSIKVYHVHCSICGATGPEKKTERGAIDAWNRRTNPTPQTDKE